MAKNKPAKTSTELSAQAWPNPALVMLQTTSAILLILGGFQLLDRYRAITGETELPESSLVLTQDLAEPDESKPEIAEYDVAPDQPRSILIDSINVAGLIQKVGLNKDNAITAPSNINFAGWYTGSVKPGELGLSIIDGHVSGIYSDGVFKNLLKLKNGDNFEIEYGDKSTRKFEVVEVSILPEKDSATFLLTKIKTIERQLNLITCGGKFDKTTQTFADRVIVVSRYIN